MGSAGDFFYHDFGRVDDRGPLFILLGLALPTGLVQSDAFLFQAGLAALYLNKAKKIRWGFVAVKLAIVSVYGLFVFYPELNGEWMLSFFDLLNLIWLAELPWLGLDFSANPKP